ncbi:MAG: CO dehydrogenase/CO-methylating acetyl-CoA synthase complex subunit beta [Dehalococcoidia bacterium]
MVTGLPEGKVYKLPLDVEDLYTGLEGIGVGPRFVRHYRKGEWHLELGGPKHEYTSFLYADVVLDADKIEDGKVELIGPEINEIPPETSLPFALYVKVQGPGVVPELSPLIERFAMMGILYLEGLMINGSRATTWIRLSKKMAPKLSFKLIGQAIRAALMASAPIILAVEVKWVIGTPEVGGRDKIEELMNEVSPVWHGVDAKLMAIKDEDVDTFYACTVCRLIAPNHVCVISPEHLAFCGIVNYMGAQVINALDPSGWSFAFPRGEVIDSDLGAYSGIDEMLPAKSGGVHKHFNIHSAIKYPMTNCGCMEAAAFYIPEVDGIGVIQRRYTGLTPLGINFGKIAAIMSGGIQNHGFKGLAVGSMKYPKFLRGDGGWNRVVWMPRSLKTEIADWIPEEIYQKIATEEDAIDVNDLKAFLKRVNHPVTQLYWKEGVPQPIALPLPGEDWSE